MGVDRATVQFLLNAERVGVSLERVLTIGRQQFYITPEDLHGLLVRNQRPCSMEDTRKLWNQEKGYCEPFLSFIGAGEVSSMDISSYENATILHDLNQPLPAQWDEQFTLVMDCGSLEHVFQYPTAMANCMRAVKTGGHLLIVTPANNQMGHGFYQFSPELLFRSLSPANGFQMTRMLIYEQPFTGTWYQVADPARIRTRVELVNRKPAYLIACAQRTSVVPILPARRSKATMPRRGRRASTAARVPTAGSRGFPAGLQICTVSSGRFVRVITVWHPRRLSPNSGAATKFKMEFQCHCPTQPLRQAKINRFFTTRSRIALLLGSASGFSMRSLTRSGMDCWRG